MGIQFLLSGIVIDFKFKPGRKIAFVIAVLAFQIILYVLLATGDAAPGSFSALCNTAGILCIEKFPGVSFVGLDHFVSLAEKKH